MHDETPASVAPKLKQIIAERAVELERGALIIVEDARYRMRHLPINQQDSA